ncbi:MAG TPA: hypothetical protein VNZ56_02670 [Verrucomicrobiae bacterium]|nr:hypothetical protein [Verrucomicrobiae bacterium]
MLFALYDNQFGWSGGGEMGPAFLLPSGKAVFIGGNPVMGIYDPVANTWSQSCIAPNGPATLGSPLSAPDVGGAMMVNGDILLALRFAATPYDVTPSPVFFYEYDYSQGAYSEVRAPGNPGSPSPWADCGQPQMLDLPDGSVLLHSSCSAQLWVYQPTGSPLQPGQPQVQTVSAVGGSCSTCYLLTGKGLDGISEGASYGDDAQIATDFPIVRVGDGIGNIAYARTFNWSNVSLLSEAPGSTYFQILGGIPACELQLVANGNPSSWFPLSQCTLASAVVPICGLQCILGSAVIWSRPNPLGDPWIDGVSLTLLTPGDPDSVELASDEQVLVDTQSLVKSEAARQIAVSGVGSTSIVGPTVELRSRAASDRRALPKGRAFAGMVSIPYEPRGLARAATVRIVRFDDLRRRWVAVPAPQKVDESKHIVTAGISGMGKFTVVAENPR